MSSAERPSKTPGLDAWLPDSYGPDAPFFGVDRTKPSTFFTRAYIPDSLLTKVRRHVARWLAPEGGL